MKVELPLGDVVDKVSILRIKEARLSDPTALAHVMEELEVLVSAWTSEGHPPVDQLPQWSELCEVNDLLWEVEDALRDHERRGAFGGDFVELARSVYRLNDRRAALKREVSEALGSALVEEKGYAPY